MPIQPGLVSVTFRKLTPQQVVAAARDAGIRSIEWGGDIHVPHGDVEVARSVAALTRDAGLSVSAYGSYYRAGAKTEKDPAFPAVLDSAVAMGAPVIRVWAGRKGSDVATKEERDAVAKDLRDISAAAAGRCRIALEFHANTLTDTLASTLAVLDAAKHDNLYTYWQPPSGRPLEQNLTELKQVLPRLLNLHVYHWSTPADRRPLAEGADDWRQYLAIAATQPNCQHASLEFVRGDDVAQLKPDAATLGLLLGEI
jgi:sugar phosphate isomerase/epimerase